ncbi:MAG: oligosaccharide flippase family protein [Firmicutes bacterium]|nr:oligosaccharide flippase family protein [Bacillota bacterium]
MGIISNKFIAVLLGTTGMGIAGLITSTTSFIASLTGFGLHTSAVRDVSQAYTSGDQNKINNTVSVLRKLIIITGLLGTVVTFIFSNTLSIWAFGNSEYSIGFKIVSIILFIDQLCIGQTVLLQGTFHYKYMAKASLFGSIAGLLLTIPLYYIWRINAIIPAIIIVSLINLSLTTFYAKKLSFQKVKMNFKEFFAQSKIMLAMGLAIAAASVITLGQNYILKIFVSNYGDISDVGLYTAAITISTAYIGVIFSAMGSDYAPRLAAVAKNNQEMIQIINKQSVLLITIICPLIITFVVFAKQIILLLYSAAFLDIAGMVEWMMIGMIFRAISWAMSFSFVARGDSKQFFWNELLANIYSLIFMVIGYFLYGFIGMGIAFAFNYLCYTIQMYIFTYKRFHFTFNLDFFKIVLPQIIICIFFFIIIQFIGYSTLRYLIGSIFILLMLAFSVYYLNSIINIKNIFNLLKHKIKDK